MIALVGAMFVVMQPASAHSVGECSDPEYLSETKCNAETGGTTDDDEDTAGWTEAAHSGANHPPALTISFDDSDGIVAAGTQVGVTVTSSGILGSDPGANNTDAVAIAEVSLSWIRTSGELDDPVTLDGDGDPTTLQLGLTASPSDMDDASVGTVSFAVIVPVGTTPGSYTVSAMVTGAFDYDGDPVTNKVASKAFTVGDAGTGLASATLSLGNRVDDDPATVTDEARAESGSDVADGPFTEANEAGINLVATASNSLGNKSNTGDVNEITVIAPGGTVTVTGEVDPDNAPNRYMGDGTNSAELGGSAAADKVKVGQTIGLNVQKADRKPGTVDVYVILTGSGAAISETITLSFTGDASSLSIGDASGTLHNQVTDADGDDRDKITFALSANDAGGSDAGVPKGTVRVFDPSGVRVGTDVIKTTQGPNAAGAPNALITLETLKAAPSSVKAGEYTVKLSAGEHSAEQTFTVAGKADAISLETESSTDTVELGSLITITADVSSGDAPVAEKTLVTFTPAGALKLAYVGVGDKAQARTQSGMASVQFVVSEGSGLASVIVTAGNASATTSISTAAEDAMADEEASVACLSNLAGFATWACGVESSASEIFGLVSGRGATALHLWNGSAWVRYSVVDGTMVPGSSDFMVAENDILYISN